MIADFEYLGDGGIGTYTQSGGVNRLNNNMSVGVNSSGAGTYNLSGGNFASTNSSSTVYVGWAGGNRQLQSV